ncbi:unnamed protein product [Adineta steineri]|uniref:Uncharacterized protein n=1 Tax=Adineta steineri TaxID=433720 RepID=A0A813ZDF6_9BILA|nr:unnamed protein product [Adineta steineri]CAF1010443.1 unnamed protein product [Adineta steineri]CAF1077683.1 unnamed protein product [Adineta steineri]
MPSHWFFEFKTKIKRINLFQDNDKTNEEDIKNQKISTIIFLILFTISIIALFLYSSLTPITKTVVVKQPFLSDYKQLEEKYSNTLLCACTSVSNEYNKFISSFTPTFNQVCSSDFVSDEWLNYVNYRLLLETQYHFYQDFRHSAYGFFAMLRTLCVLAKQTIDDELVSFYSTTLLTENTISEDIFLANINATRDQFIATSANDFIITLDSVLLIGGVSVFVINRLETNWNLLLYVYQNIYFSPDWISQLYTTNENCIHETTVYCGTTTGIYLKKLLNETSSSDLLWGHQYVAESQFEVPGVFVSPFILGSVFLSNLSCLYNESCLSKLNTYLNDSLSPFNATPLAIPSSAPFLPTINDLAKQLMVDFWQLNSSYGHYFNACNPLTCTYTYTHQFDILFIITTVISFIGGIVTVLMIVILPTVKFLRKQVKTFNRLLSSLSEVVPYETNNERQAVGDTTEQKVSLFVRIKIFLLNLNLFSDPDENSEWYLYGQRLSTRFFIISIIIAFSILILYASTYSVTKTIIINKPSIGVYLTLQDKYPQTLTCPCLSTTTEHSQFISFQPTQHPVCHSDFITDNWTNYLEVLGSGVIDQSDYRYSNRAFFPTILTFCQLSQKTINNELIIFNSTKYVTKYAQEIDLFNSQTQQLISNMKQTTVNSFQLLMSMFRQTVWGNALFSTLTYYYTYDPTVNYDFNSTINPNDLNLVFFPRYYQSSLNTTCSCKIHPTTCNQLSSITYTNGALINGLFPVPGSYVGCYASESIFRSTFQCFFDQICLQTIYNLILSRSKVPFNATAMQSNSTRYNLTASVQDIIDDLMIEEWNNETSFQFYYKQCNPYLCSYSYDVKGDISYIIAITFGLIGGLTTILKIIIPFIVLTIRRWRQKRRIGTNQSMINHDIQTITIGQKLKISILTFNLFKNRNKRLAEQLQQQRFSTRFFLIITLISLVILVFYVSFENITHTIIKNNPTITEFNKLYQEYPNTVQCPCETYSITYEEFITFQPHLHSICSSTFVDETSEWLIIDYPQTMLSGHNGGPTYSTRTDDFRQIGSPFFQLLNSFCNLSFKTMNAELTTFYSSRFITLNLITFEQFQTQTNQLVNQFIKNTARSFINSLFFAENMTAANMLLSAFQSDSLLSSASPLYDYNYYPDFFYQYVYDRTDQIYNSNETGIDCDCQSTPWCIQQAIVYDLDTTTELFSPPGIFVGCYLVEAVLQSDLRCFFDIDCLQQLINSLSLENISVSDIILNSTASHYQEKSSLLEIVSNLMVEEWNNQTFYDNYFNICQPSVCTATYISHGNIVYIITTTIGLIGGLTKVYRFIVPIFLKIMVRVIIPFIRKKCGMNNNEEI